MIGNKKMPNPKRYSTMIEVAIKLANNYNFTFIKGQLIVVDERSLLIHCHIDSRPALFKINEFVSILLPPSPFNMVHVLSRIISYDKSTKTLLVEPIETNTFLVILENELNQQDKTNLTNKAS